MRGGGGAAQDPRLLQALVGSAATSCGHPRDVALGRCSPKQTLTFELAFELGLLGSGRDLRLQDPVVEEWGGAAVARVVDGDAEFGGIHALLVCSPKLLAPSHAKNYHPLRKSDEIPPKLYL